MPTQDEYWTSQKCHKCKDPHTFLVDGPRYREKACVTCGPINRDLNAAANLEFVWTWWLEHRQRPEYLQPPAPDGDAPKGRRRRAKAGAGAGGAKAPSKAGGAKAPSKAGGAKAKAAGAQGAAAVSPPTKRKRTAAVRGGSESGAAAGGTST
jgi:hypothetical protein